MKVSENKLVSLSYNLTVDGHVVESVTAEQPLEFIFGTGNLLPKFEENVEQKQVGDKFNFTLTSENAYGEVIEDAVVELPKELFVIDGELDESLLTIGNMLPMTDNDGNRLVGFVKAVSPEAVTMDFNHPMAGKTLHFEGEVVGVREATPEDFLKGQMLTGDDCGCGEGCECGSDGDDQGCGCGSGCGCH